MSLARKFKYYLLQHKPTLFCGTTAARSAFDFPQKSECGARCSRYSSEEQDGRVSIVSQHQLIMAQQEDNRYAGRRWTAFKWHHKPDGLANKRCSAEPLLSVDKVGRPY